MVEWRNSEDKKRLCEDIIYGKVLDNNMPANIINNMHDAGISCSKINLNNFRKSLK